jgi:hypothetical protein
VTRQVSADDAVAFPVLPEGVNAAIAALADDVQKASDDVFKHFVGMDGGMVVVILMVGSCLLLLLHHLDRSVLSLRCLVSPCILIKEPLSLLSSSTTLMLMCHAILYQCLVHFPQGCTRGREWADRDLQEYRSGYQEQTLNNPRLHVIILVFKSMIS